jgi:hypothetical protein
MGVKGSRPARKADNSPPPVSLLSARYGSLDASQPYGPPRTVTGIDLTFFTAICEPTVYKIWEPRRLTTLWASMDCYRNVFSFILFYSYYLP